MCRMACEDGVAMASATAHQSERWSSVTPDKIRDGTRKLAVSLREQGIPLSVFPCAEVMAHPRLVESWENQDHLSVADRGKHLLIEMPDGLFVDLRETAYKLGQLGIQPILAHAERQSELLHEPGHVEDLIEAGCLIQVSADSVTEPATRKDARTLKQWFKRGMVHVMGSDGHSPKRRPPRMAGAYERIAEWAGARVADRVCSTNGIAILQGMPLRIAEPLPASSRWLSVFW